MFTTYVTIEQCLLGETRAAGRASERGCVGMVTLQVDLQGAVLGGGVFTVCAVEGLLTYYARRTKITINLK